VARSTLSVSTAAGARPVGAEDVGAAGTEYRETIQLGGAAAAELADVKNAAPAAAAYGVITRALLYDASGNPLLTKTTAPAAADSGLVTRSMLYDASGAPIQQQQNTYHATVRLAARPYALSFTTVANTRKQFATIHHAATATKLVKLRRVLVALESVSVAGIYVFELVRITSAPATGNPAITPIPVLPSAAAAEVTVLALPTTAATEAGSPVNLVEYNQGITGAAPVVNPPQPVTWVELFSEDEQNPVGEQQSPQIRAGTLEGWSVTLDPSAAGVVKAFVKFVFTEQ
jgi:hypothetical protein